MARQSGGRGRRPGDSGAQQSILEAARSLFAARGYTGTSIRAVAAAAQVDPALVHHYFGTKEGLFRAAVELPIDPSVVVASVVAAGPADLPLMLVQAFLRVWEGPDTGPSMIGFLRRVLAEPESAELMRDFANASILARMAETLYPGLDRAEAEARVGLAGSHLLGLVVARRILGLPAVASIPAEQLAAAVAPAIAHYLYDELPLAADTGTQVADPTTLATAQKADHHDH